jgi:hypothetical protein
VVESRYWLKLFIDIYCSVGVGIGSGQPVHMPRMDITTKLVVTSPRYNLLTSRPEQDGMFKLSCHAPDASTGTQAVSAYI